MKSHPSRSAAVLRVLQIIALAATLASARKVFADPQPGALSSRHIATPIAIDGRLDDQAWAEARPYSDFIESFPSVGKAPDFKTEARVLHDDTFLYIGIRCYDPDPSQIVKNLGRRDSTPFADLVEIAIDSSGDHRTAFDFSINAAGVLRDQLLFSDFNATDTWDAVWNGATQVSADGWTAEVAVPLRALRFSPDADTWGFQIRRVVPRTHQVFDSKLIAREANANNPGALVVSRFGTLDGVAHLQPGHALEIMAYTAPRLTLRPQFRDPLKPEPRLVDPAIDVGVDFKFSLTGTLLLTGTINPDFGQVDADQVIQNLSTAEAFFPEKRPFFLQGLDVFQPVGAEYGTPQQLFYSRRIGLRTPILAAVKLTGSLTSSLDIGVLDSVVMGAANPSARNIAFGQGDATTFDEFESAPDRRIAWHPQAPLHFGLNDQLPIDRPVPTNYLAAVARQRFYENSSVGAVLTAATPLAARCERADFTSDEAYQNANCSQHGVNALGLDWNLRTKDGVWGFFGQLEGSQQVFGNPEGRRLVDGTVIKPGDLGVGGNLRAGKLGGEPFRFDVTYVYEGPKLDLNAMGFQPLNNYQWADLNLHYVRPNGIGPFHALNIDYNLDLNWSADAQLLPRGVNSNINAAVQLPSFDWVGLRIGAEIPQFDSREIQFSGVPFQRQPDIFAAAYTTTDPNRRLALSGDLFAYHLLAFGVEQPGWGWGGDATIVWHPVDALETRLDANFGHKPQGARWVDTIDGVAFFGWQDPAFLSFTLRQQVVVTPRLTFQVYAQLFSGAVSYAPYYSASIEGQTSLPGERLTVASYSGNANEHSSALNINAVLRWEYRLGSTLFFVYTHSQQERGTAPGAAVAQGVLPSGLFGGPASDTFLVKWTYWFSV